MKKVLRYLFASLLFCGNTNAQNLVSNPSFETFNACPGGFSTIDHASPASYATYAFPTVTNWIRGTVSGTPDYFNICATNAIVGMPNNIFGTQGARSGNGYAGIWALNYQNGAISTELEYVETKLTAPFITGHRYSISFYVSVATIPGSPSSVCGIDRIGALVSQNQTYVSTNFISFAPSIVHTAGQYIKDTVNWVQVKGTYTAVGGEQWLTIGAFWDPSIPVAFDTIVKRPGGNGVISYLYLEDVCVMDLSSFITSTVRKKACADQLPLRLEPAHLGGFQHKWQNNDTNSFLNVSAPGVYSVTYLKDCAQYSDTFIVDEIVANPKLNLGKDTFICNGQTARLTSNHTYSSYRWSNGDTTRSINIAQPGQYTLQVSNYCGIQTDTINIAILTKPPLPQINDTIICLNTIAPRLNVPPGVKLHWFTDETGAAYDFQPFVITNKRGVTAMYVSAYNDCEESDKKKVLITVQAPPAITILSDSILCDGETLMIRATATDYTKYAWNTGDTQCCFAVTTPGIYRLEATGNCGVTSATVNVVYSDCNNCIFIPTAFTPNNDGKNDKYRIISQCRVGIGGYHLTIVNRWGQAVFNSYVMDQSWDGTFNGKPADSGVYFYRLEYMPGIQGGKSIVRTGDMTLLR